MKKTIERQISRILKENRNHRAWVAAVLALAIVVSLGTVAVLRMPGIAMTGQTRVLDCPYADGSAVLAHTHNDDCYDAEGNLVCTLPEIPEHHHDESCYTVENVLVCGLEESEGHTHSDDCYELVQCALICEDESEEHEHTDECYEWTRELVCGLEESEGHVHTDACYEQRTTLTCGMVETEGVHVHGEECFRVEENAEEDTAAQNTPDVGQETSADWEKLSTTGSPLT